MTVRRLELFVIVTVIGIIGIVYALTQQYIDPSTYDQDDTAAEVQEVSASAIQYQGEDGKNALEILKSSHNVQTQDFAGVGEFVTAIDGIEPDATHFWSLYVNGAQAQVGASAYITESSDQLEWRLEKIN